MIATSSRRGNKYQQERRHVVVVFFVLLSMMMISSISGFGVTNMNQKKFIVSSKTSSSSSSILSLGSSIITEENESLPEILNGAGESSGCMETTSTNEEELFEGMSLSVSGEDGISLASPLTYDKFLTMQVYLLYPFYAAL